MTNIEIRTQGVYDQLSKSERKVADYFLHNRQSIFNEPIAQLAANAGVSKVTWVRFCKAIGYDGLKDMKRALFLEMQDTAQESGEEDTEEKIIFRDVKDFISVAQMARAVQYNSVSAIENTFKLLDFAVVEQVARAIVQARGVKLFAVGASALVAEDLYSKLLRIGKSVCFSLDSHVQLTYAANLTNQDVAILISYSGMTREVVETLALAKESGACCVGITRYGKSQLAAGADLLLSVSASEAHHRSGAMSSRLAQLAIVDLLFTAVANQDYVNVKKRLENSYRSCLSHKVE